MDDDLVQLQELARELAAAAPLEVFPVEAMPVPAAIGWMSRLLLLSGRHAPLLAFLGALFENTALLGFLLPGGTAVVLAGAGARTAGVPLALVVALAAAGMTAGAGVDYALGRGAAYRKCPHLVAPAWRLHSGGVLERAPQFSIGQLARRTGIPVRTIRFWSDAGVLPPSGRTESGYRLYDAEDVARLELVRTLRDLGVGLEAVQKLLSRQASVRDVA